MKLVEIYQCLCDETRLRILHLLAQGPLCVCHFQAILKIPQVAVSTAQRHEQWMIYQLPELQPESLKLQMKCLSDCVREQPVFKQDLRRLKTVRSDCCWIEEVSRQPKKKRAAFL
jgi:ArsR family transcriptional regulator